MARKIGSLEGKIESVELECLRVDHETYQRSEKRSVDRIASDFEPAAVGTLHVGRRADGTLWLIDGQQRVAAMRQLGIKTWKAYVVHSPGPKYEARLYSYINGRTRKQLTAHEIFRANVAAEDPNALAVLRAVQAAGLRLKAVKGGARGWPEIACVGALYREVATKGEGLLTRVLTVLARTWPEQPVALHDVIPVAMLRLFAAQGDRIDDDRFVEVLSAVPPVKILNDSAVSTGNRFTQASNVLARAYNKRLGESSRLRIVTEDAA